MIKRSGFIVALETVVGLGVLLIGFLSGCDSAQEKKSARDSFNHSILANAPCFDNVCLGNESRSTYSERLQKSQFVEAVYDNGGSPLNFTIINPDPDGIEDESMGGGVLQFERDAYGKFEILKSISIGLSGLTLGTAIDVLGEPEEYLLITGCGMGYWVFGLALYPSRGIFLRSNFQTRNSEQEHLDAEKEVTITFTAPQRFEEHLLEVLDTGVLDSVAFDLAPQVNADLLLSQIQSWPGLDTAPTPSINLCPR